MRVGGELREHCDETGILCVASGMTVTAALREQDREFERLRRASR